MHSGRRFGAAMFLPGDGGVSAFLVERENKQTGANVASNGLIWYMIWQFWSH